ncbi:phage scaffolding protein [Clostridioides difficile]|uniref:phage scaffolding protein n=2 Tax=Clostridioides difficile TaxID=1496 RepID=UPI0010AF2EC0|nr:phage scaffolding protein [Clostridioides difficile]VHY71609.1 scaffold protein [Clostridioides difficile]VHY74690.1 scaffold protein [Clostridioides difficile]
MDWLKELLEGIKIENNKIDVVSLQKSIEKKIKETTVTKEEYTNLETQLNTANTTIKKFEGGMTKEDVENLKDTHNNDLEKLKKDMEISKKEYELKGKLKDLGVVDVDYIIYKQGGTEKFNFDNEGKVIGLEDTIKVYKENSPHLFTGGKLNYIPKSGDDYKGSNPWLEKSFNLTEQSKIYNDNPALAKELMTAAGK